MNNKSISLTAILCFIAFQFAVAQKTKTVKIEHKTPQYTEVFQVLKEEPDIRHGRYQSFRYKGALTTEGFYKQGQKDSIWNEYYNGKVISKGYYTQDLKTGEWINYWPDSNILSKGHYKDGEKSGIWEYFGKDNKLFQKYDFNHNELLFYTEDTLSKKQIEFTIKNGSGELLIIPDRVPMYQSGESGLFSAISKNIRYPELALDNNIEGTVVISFWISTDGMAFDYEVEKGLEGGLSEEAMRVVMLLKANWIPAIYNEQPVVTKMNMPLRFKLSK